MAILIGMAAPIAMFTIYIMNSVYVYHRAFDDIIVNATETHRLSLALIWCCKPNFEHGALGNFDTLITPQMLDTWTRLHRLLNLAITILPIEMIDSIACIHPSNHLKKTCRILISIIIVIFCWCCRYCHCCCCCLLLLLLLISNYPYFHSTKNVWKKKQHDIFSHQSRAYWAS